MFSEAGDVQQGIRPVMCVVLVFFFFLLTYVVCFQMTWDMLFISLGAVYLLASFYKCRSRIYCCGKHIDFLWGLCKFRYL